jgi:hypothetical protein
MWAHRSVIEAAKRQPKKMALHRLHARGNAGIALKSLHSFLALTFTDFRQPRRGGRMSHSVTENLVI